MKKKWCAVGWVALYVVVDFAIQFAVLIGLMFSFFFGSMMRMDGGVGNREFMEFYQKSVEKILQDENLMLITLAIDFTTLVGFALWYYFRESKYNFRPDYRRAITKTNVLAALGIGFFGQFACNLIIWLEETLMPGQMAKYEETVGIFSSEDVPLWLLILTVCIVGPILEETFFRGMIYGKLRRAFSMGPCVIASAIIFGVAHMNVIQGIYAGVFGVVLALAYEKSQTLYIPILMHVSFNSMSYFNEWIYGKLESGSGALQMGVLAFEGLSLFIVVILTMTINYKKKEVAQA